MWIITSVLWRSKGLVREIRNRNNSRTQGKPYGSKGPEPTYTFGSFKKKSFPNLNPTYLLLSGVCLLYLKVRKGSIYEP